MPKITSSRYNSKAFNLVLLILSALLLQLLLILCVHAYWGERSIIDYSFHIYPIMTSPVFLLLLLGAFAYGNYLWCLYLDKTMKADNVAVSFISDRKKVSVPKQSILFIESRDKEVWVYTVDGNHYRNKTPISQWENVLGFEFVRIHRAYLVSKCAICGFDDETVSIAQHSLPVSKKYKGALQELLRQQPQT